MSERAECSISGSGSWSIVKCSNAQVEELSREAGISRVLARLAINRGITDPGLMSDFLDGSVHQLSSPETMKDLPKAADRLVKALHSGEKVGIHGDYDADGICSAAVLARFFNKAGLKYCCHLPDRVRDGYGVSDYALKFFSDSGCTVMVTVDCGISDFEAIDKAAGLGMDVIVTDHHVPADRLPQAVAIVNPRQEQCGFPFKHYAGAGVAFALVRAMASRLNIEDPVELLELVALGTVADCVPLLGENRILVREGLRKMRLCRENNMYPGLYQLIVRSGLRVTHVNSENISFSLAPQLNAAGRLDSPLKALQLLVSEDVAETYEIAGYLGALNRKRRQISAEILAEARQMYNRFEACRTSRLPFFSNSGWNIGVIGCVCSRLKEELNLPVIMISVDDNTGEAIGSIRSVEWFPLDKILPLCSDIMGRYGGHAMAAGFTVESENISELRNRLCVLFEEWQPVSGADARIDVEMELSFRDINWRLLKEINRLRPFGTGNPRPLFVTSGLEVSGICRMGPNREHIKLSLCSEDSPYSIEGVGFGMAEKIDCGCDNMKLDVVYEIDENTWRGTRRIQLKLKDFVSTSESCGLSAVQG